MRKILMAAVALSLVGSALAQQGAPASQNRAGNSQGNSELFFMIEQLQAEVRRMQGELEEQRHQLNRLAEQSRERYIDLDQRLLGVLKKVESQPAPAQAGPGAEKSVGNDVPAKEYRQPTEEERQAYQRIQKLIHEEKKYDAAIDAIYDFISSYPEGDLTVNAYYWLGEVYLVKPQLEQAKQAFTIVATRYEDHRKAADAAYKLGVTLDRLGDKDKARQQMQSVMDEYPGTKAAELARVYLAQ
ncbi:tol-pal system protein YbgF [Marinobacter sp.]|uniref:tol-pal system protein YbgF n=1 Tax=Marinobacter sp. TaxID=50741 RepID=UPI00385082F1